MSAPAFLSVSGSPVTSTGTLALAYSGTALPAANGGTGQTSYTDGQLLIGNTAGGLSKSTLTAGSGVLITNGNGSITISASGTSGVSSFNGGGTGLTPATATTGAITLGGTLAVANGGTGGTTQATARAGLGLGTVATLNSISLTSNVTGTLPLANGGTGSTTASGARTSLGLGSLATLSSISNTNWSGTDLAINNGGTGVSVQPTFSAYASASQLGLSPSTPTKINCNVELWDNNNNYNTTLARFLPTVTGYYQINGIARITPGSGTTGSTGCSVAIYLNGSEYRRGAEIVTQDAIYVQPTISVIVYLNGSTDYVELWAGYAPYGEVGVNPGFQYDSAVLTSNWSAAFLMNA